MGRTLQVAAASRGAGVSHLPAVPGFQCPVGLNLVVVFFLLLLLCGNACMLNVLPLFLCMHAQVGRTSRTCSSTTRRRRAEWRPSRDASRAQTANALLRSINYSYMGIYVNMCVPL